MTDHSGPLSNFPFGAFAFARLDDRLAESEEWKTASRKPGRDPMGLQPNQPNVEFFNTEAYGGAQANSPITTESAFAMLVNLFGPRSTGTVVLKSAKPEDNSIIDHNYLSHDLDALVLAEGCSLANEIVMSGDGIRGVVKNSWPPNPAFHENKTGEDWMAYVRDMATTCKTLLHSSNRLSALCRITDEKKFDAYALLLQQLITQLEPVRLAS